MDFATINDPDEQSLTNNRTKGATAIWSKLQY